MKSTKTRPGNRYLKGVLGIAAITAARSKNTYFSAKYRRIASRRPEMRALVAVEHAMVIAAFNMLTNGDFYRDPGPDYYTARQARPNQGTSNQPTRNPRIPRHFGTTRQYRVAHHRAESTVVVTPFLCQRGPSPSYQACCNEQ